MLSPTRAVGFCLNPISFCHWPSFSLFIFRRAPLLRLLPASSHNGEGETRQSSLYGCVKCVNIKMTLRTRFTLCLSISAVGTLDVRMCVRLMFDANQNINKTKQKNNKIRPRSDENSTTRPNFVAWQDNVINSAAKPLKATPSLARCVCKGQTFTTPCGLQHSQATRDAKRNAVGNF